MNKSLKNLKLPIDVLLVFLISLLILVPQAINACHLFATLGFDAQNHTVWSYLSGLGAIPIRDTHHPHGLLSVYASSNFYIYIIYAVLPAFHYSLLYIVMKRLFKRDIFMLYAMFLFVFIFTISIMGIAHINRYGLIISVPSLAAFLIYKYNLKNISFIIAGVIAGLVTSSSLAIGTLVVAVILPLIFFSNPGLLNRENVNHLPHYLLRKFINFGVGFLVGLAPLIIFLAINQVWLQYYSFIKEIFYASQYAKNSIVYSRILVFIILVVILQVFALIAQILQRKLKNNRLYFYLLITTFTSSILIMQKSLIRQMDHVVINFTIFSLSVLVSNLSRNKAFVKSNILKVLVLMFIFIFPTVFSFPVSVNKYLKNISMTIKTIAGKNVLPGPLCKLDKSDVREKIEDSSYLEVADYIEKENKNALVFSYPYDPIFYLLLEQKPPPYLNVYEGSPLIAQEKNIKYLIENDIEYVIYNTDPVLIDNVPEYIRASTLNSYILREYKPFHQHKKFVLLKKKNRDEEYFIQNRKENEKFSSLSDRILNTNFSGVFLSEGYHKAERLLSEGRLIYEGGGVGELNGFFNKNEISSSQLFLLVKFSSETSKTVTMISRSSGGVLSKVIFQSCVDNYCLIRLSRLPAFYQNAKIDGIKFNHNVELVKLIILEKESEYYW